MATRTKLTPFARLLLFLLFLVPLAYGGALYLQGKDPIAEVKGMMGGASSSSSSKSSSSTYDPQQEIEKLKKENRELKQKVKELEAKIKTQESDSSSRQKWGN
ncbi:hypothetical protein [Lewinella sp. LCG006]|uniref:hypothetical protein n=1 Tax=Lewinella sp. LCG006 TaxID=3231911 RepID=UPI00345F2E47